MLKPPDIFVLSITHPVDISESRRVLGTSYVLIIAYMRHFHNTEGHGLDKYAQVIGFMKCFIFALINS